MYCIVMVEYLSTLIQKICLEKFLFVYQTWLLLADRFKGLHRCYKGDVFASLLSLTQYLSRPNCILLYMVDRAIGTESV